MDRALAFGARRWEFDSPRARLKSKKIADKELGVGFYHHIVFGNWLPCPESSRFWPYSFVSYTFE